MHSLNKDRTIISHSNSYLRKGKMNQYIALLGARSSDNPLESVPKELSLIRQLIEEKTDYNLTYEPYLTRNGLTELFRKRLDKLGIIHFAGHTNNENLQTNDAELNAQNIASYLKTWTKKPALIFLNGCTNAGQVTSFHLAGLPCVIATSRPIGDSIASEFAFEFYRELLAWPDKATLAQAFKRAGETTFNNRSGSPRSINLEEMDQQDIKWDWGIYFSSDGLHYAGSLTLSDILGCSKPDSDAGKPNSLALSGLSIVQKGKYSRAMERLERLGNLIAKMEEERDGETDFEILFGIDSRLKEKYLELKAIEIELASLSD